MATPNKDYRENPTRAIYVTGQIEQELVDRLTPKINDLRLQSCDTITAYIDSPGGSAYLAETIRRLLKAPNPDGGTCRAITVVTGTAASAAADLLALGDYAIAFPHSRILYHGSRRPAESALTYEGAASLASSLEGMNEVFAVRLARCAFPRFCIRMSQFKDQFSKYVGQTPSAVMLPITTLTTSLSKELSLSNRRLVQEAIKRQRDIENLTIALAKHISRFKKDLSFQEFEREVLRAIASYKTKLHKNDLWSLGDQGLTEVTNDFKLLRDFHSGRQKKDIDIFTRVLGELFLVSTERAEYTQLPGDQEAKFVWLKERVEARLQPLWYFVVSLCRLLQKTDYFLDPEEAYWLGLIDEVSGSGLPNVRQMMENLPPAVPASTESSPPPPEGARTVGA